jgi:hypothetical protein
MQHWMYVVLVLAMGCGASHEVGRGAAEGVLNGVQKQSQHSDNGPPPLETATQNIVRGALKELDTPEERAELARIFGAATHGALAGAAGRMPDGAPRASVVTPDGAAPEGGSTNGPRQAAAAPNAAPGAGNGVVPRAAWGGGPTLGAGSLVSPGGPMAAVGDSLSQGFAQGFSKQLQSELGPGGEGPLGKTLAALAQQISGAAANGVTAGISADLSDCAQGDHGVCAQQRIQDLSRSMGAGFAQGVANALRVPLLLGAFAAGIVATVLLLGIIRLARRPARE